DITPLLADPAAFHTAIQLMMEHYENVPIDAISAAEARGFLFAAPLAYLMHKLQYDLEYGQAELQVHIDGFNPGAKVLLIDDLLATGGTLEAACKLIEQAGAKVIGCAVLVELGFLNGREKPVPHEVFSLSRY